MKNKLPPALLIPLIAFLLAILFAFLASQKHVSPTPPQPKPARLDISQSVDERIADISNHLLREELLNLRRMVMSSAGTETIERQTIIDMYRSTQRSSIYFAGYEYTHTLPSVTNAYLALEAVHEMAAEQVARAGKLQIGNFTAEEFAEEMRTKAPTLLAEMKPR